MASTPILFIISEHHPATVWRDEALDLILTHDAFDLPSSLLFTGQGIHHLLKEPSGLDLAAFDLIDFEHIWFTEGELSERQIKAKACLSKAEVIERSKIGPLIQKFPTVLQV